MKRARTETGELIEATQTAPKAALCPACGGPVTLRGRRTMDRKSTFFWRHRDRADLHCPLRSKPV